MSVYLKSAAFTPIETINCRTQGSLQGAFAHISALISEQNSRVLGAVPPEVRQQIHRHFLCSTMIDLPFTSGAMAESDLNSLVREHNAPVTSFVNTYECASWGYSLRYYLRHLPQHVSQDLSQDLSQEPDAHYVMVSILDANLMDLSFWQSNENWGKSGFGLCTLLLAVSAIEEKESVEEKAVEKKAIEKKAVNQKGITTGCALTYNTTPEFATILRKMAKGSEDLTLSLPFFPENGRQVFTKLLAGFDQLPDRHDQWGHCFGSDPWLNIIHQGVNKPFTQRKKLLACSIALNGYYCTAEVQVDQHSLFHLSEAI